MPTEYDISRAFKKIENELMDSMMRNLKRHKAEELKEGFNWEQWQALQLKELERYRKENADKFTDDFTDINAKVEQLFKQTAQDSQTKQENYVLEQIKKGDFTPTQTKDTTFFNLNDDKLNVLIERTKADFTRAEYAVLRKANDQYRQIIFDAQVYASVTNDYNRAVDMATKDYLMHGLQSVEYKNGARHNISDYARMAVRTGNKRAYLMGEGNTHDKYGIHTVRVNKRTQACPKCVGFLGKVLVDDVYSGGTRSEAMNLNVPTLSDAVAKGFLHPNCKDIYSLYIEGVSRPPVPWTKEEINDITNAYNEEQQLQHAEDMAESYKRMAKYSLDPDNVAKYQARSDLWDLRVNELKNNAPVTPIPAVIPQTIAYTATSNTFKGFAMKGLKSSATGKGASWQMKLNPNLNDYTQIIKHTEDLAKQMPGQLDAVLKIQYQNAINKAEEEVLKLKAQKAPLSAYGGIGKKKKAWQKKLDIITTNEEIAKLQTDIADIQAHKANALPADKTFSGIWKQDVKLSEYDQYESKISAKIDYYIDKIDEWNTKGVSVYGHSQSYVDAKVQGLTDLMNSVIEFEQEGNNYKLISDQFDNALKLKQDELDKAQDKLDTLLNVKKKASAKAVITEAQRNKADFYYDIRQADKDYRSITSKAWLNSSRSAQESGYWYTYGSGAHNRPLRGYTNDHYPTWQDIDFKGVGKVSLDNEGRTNVLDLAEMIEQSIIPEDKWFARGLQDNNRNEAIVHFFGEDRNWLLNAPESELKAKLIGKVVTDEAYLSHGVVKSAGWGGHRFETFAPKGTQALYVEPFSHYGDGSYNGFYWDGKATQTSFGESEMLFQAMTDYEILDVEVVGYGNSRQFKVKTQVVYQRSAKEIRDIWEKRMKAIGKTI